MDIHTLKRKSYHPSTAVSLASVCVCVSRQCQSGTVLLSAKGAGAAVRGCRCISCNCGGGGPFLVVPHCLFSH